MSAPEPFVPATTDVRDFDGFMLNVERLLASELVAIGTPEECWAALMLWCRAWKQVPAGSLPNDDRILASFSGAGKRWPKVREVALRGFVLCSDGRLYHTFLCEEVTRAHARKVAYQERRETDKKRLVKWREKRRGNADETRFVQVVQVQGQGHISSLRSDSSVASDEATAARPPPDDPVKAIFDRGLAIYRAAGMPEDRARKLIGKQRSEFGNARMLSAIARCEAEIPSDPVAFMAAILGQMAQGRVFEKPSFGAPGFA